MTSPNNLPSSEAPTLGDILQLQATIEALPEIGLKDVNESERIAINRYPEGRHTEHGRQLSHVSKTQRMPNGSYAPVMNYFVLRDGDETSTRIIKRPPFNLPSWQDTFQGHTPFSAEGRAAHADAVAHVDGDLALAGMAEKMGLYDITSAEVHELTQVITRVYSPETPEQ